MPGIVTGLGTGLSAAAREALGDAAALMIGGDTVMIAAQTITIGGI